MIIRAPSAFLSAIVAIPAGDIAGAEPHGEPWGSINTGAQTIALAPLTYYRIPAWAVRSIYPAYSGSDPLQLDANACVNALPPILAQLQAQGWEAGTSAPGFTPVVGG